MDTSPGLHMLKRIQITKFSSILGLYTSKYVYKLFQSYIHNWNLNLHRYANFLDLEKYVIFMM